MGPARIRKSDKTNRQVSFIWFITVTVSNDIDEYFLANSCLKMTCELVSSLQSDYLRKCCRYENLLTRLFVNVVLYKILSL